MPFVFVTGVVAPAAMDLLLSDTPLLLAKELATVFTKLTLDNRSPHIDFARLSTDYLSEVLHYNRGANSMLNLCLDDRVYFAFSRRGAMAITADPDDIPAVFVIPSLLNLFEILRARLVAGVYIGSRLADLAERLTVIETEVNPIDDAEYSDLRKLVTLNLENPLYYLFDGGSVTELATAAEDALFVKQIWADVRESFDAVDRLRTLWEATRFRRQYGS